MERKESERLVNQQKLIYYLFLSLKNYVSNCIAYPNVTNVLTIIIIAYRPLRVWIKKLEPSAIYAKGAE